MILAAYLIGNAIAVYLIVRNRVGGDPLWYIFAAAIFGSLALVIAVVDDGVKRLGRWLERVR